MVVVDMATTALALFVSLVLYSTVAGHIHRVRQRDRRALAAVLARALRPAGPVPGPSRLTPHRGAAPAGQRHPHGCGAAGRHLGHPPGRALRGWLLTAGLSVFVLDGRRAGGRPPDRQAPPLRGQALAPVVLVGDNSEADELVTMLQQSRELGYDVVGRVSDERPADGSAAHAVAPPALPRRHRGHPRHRARPRTPAASSWRPRGSRSRAPTAWCGTSPVRASTSSSPRPCATSPHAG